MSGQVAGRSRVMVEPSSDVLILQVLPDRDEDAEQLDDLTAILREELLELEVTAVEPILPDRAPQDTKGVVAAIGGWLAVHFGPASVRAVMKAVAAWAGRNGKSVELTLSGNTLKLTGASADMQSRIVDEFFARQSPSA
jgi:hypothetical protein